LVKLQEPPLTTSDDLSRYSPEKTLQHPLLYRLKIKKIKLVGHHYLNTLHRTSSNNTDKAVQEIKLTLGREFITDLYPIISHVN
jgi:hypothetical protein